MNLTGKTALVTGSTSGIGLGIALKLAEAGANLMLNGFGDSAAALAAVAETASCIPCRSRCLRMRRPRCTTSTN